eukprot:CAMPEP_0182452264 /NCGR_PEP_ID=MMETSP1172-20130603/44159_1 /TAXON_ID=708627 /ORGANISM="Timspurckia oligopyrenoides, Strain CCMP3278" /LENGTH=190 /DNA_ID=CAMNT_0024650089 /DNA_START=451 /DNA_END=1023 /DNA_ORIENTATION=-
MNTLIPDSAALLTSCESEFDLISFCNEIPSIHDSNVHDLMRIHSTQSSSSTLHFHTKLVAHFFQEIPWWKSLVHQGHIRLRLDYIDDSSLKLEYFELDSDAKIVIKGEKRLVLLMKSAFGRRLTQSNAARLKQQHDDELYNVIQARAESILLALSQIPHIDEIQNPDEYLAVIQSVLSLHSSWRAATNLM